MEEVALTHSNLNQCKLPGNKHVPYRYCSSYKEPRARNKKNGRMSMSKDPEPILLFISPLESFLDLMVILVQKTGQDSWKGFF